MARCLLKAKHREHCIAKKTNNNDLMKAITIKEFISLVAVAMAASVLTLAAINVGVLVARSNGLLLLALTLCGAVVSGINGLGRRTVNIPSASRSSREGPRTTVALPS